MIVGAGPAGLSAAIYMGRFLRDVVVLDSGSGRSSFEQVNDNYPGFPEGIKVRQLRELGRRQAERFGVQFVDCVVERLRSTRPFEGPTPSQVDALGEPPEDQGMLEAQFSTGDRDFIAYTDKGPYAARTVILCTGVCDQWPDMPGVLDYVGRSLFWCIVCDGFRTVGKKIVLYGADDDAAASACQFNLYTKDITFVAPPGGLDCPEERIEALHANGIKIVEGVPARFVGRPGALEGVMLEDGTCLDAELMFSLLPPRANNRLALDLGVECSPRGYVFVDEEGYTNVPGVFCAGDLSRMHTHQVVAAAAEGAEAAQTANYYLYADYQKVDMPSREGGDSEPGT